MLRNSMEDLKVDNCRQVGIKLAQRLVTYSMPSINKLEFC